MIDDLPEARLQFRSSLRHDKNSWNTSLSTPPSLRTQCRGHYVDAQRLADGDDHSPGPRRPNAGTPCIKGGSGSRSAPSNWRSAGRQSSCSRGWFGIIRLRNALTLGASASGSLAGSGRPLSGAASGFRNGGEIDLPPLRDNLPDVLGRTSSGNTLFRHGSRWFDLIC